MAGRKRVIVGDVHQRRQRQKPRHYNEAVVQELIKLWELLNYACGKRLVAIMPELITKLEQFGELRLSPGTKEKLLRISATTVEEPGAAALLSERAAHFHARSSYRKNDNCFVEQKNYSVVRQTVGYQRFDTAAELMVLQRMYATLRLYTNFFQPTMKLKSKERVGSRVKKSYHAPQTPYQRLLACAKVTVADKKQLQRQYRLLNPAALKRELDKQRKKLFRLANKKRPLKLKRHRNQRGLGIKPLLSI